MRPRFLLLILITAVFIVHCMQMRLIQEELKHPSERPSPPVPSWLRISRSPVESTATISKTRLPATAQQQPSIASVPEGGRDGFSSINVPDSERGSYVPVQRFTGQPWDLPTSCVILRPYPPGGIGDQLYRYAYAYAAAHDLNTTLYIVRQRQDESERTFGAQDRAFALDNFQLDSTRVQFMDEAIFNAIPGWRGFLLDELGPWRSHQLPRDRIVVVTEFWQSDMYFRQYAKEIQAQFVPKDEVSVHGSAKRHLMELVRQIEETESVAVHVRRGDFQVARVYSHLYRVLPISYQIRAMELLSYILEAHRERNSAWPPVTFFVFSDDIAYTRREMAGLDGRLRLVFVDDEGGAPKRTSIDDFELMCMCKHNIIPNSGFGWWSAWLNPNPTKLVVAPFPRHRLRFYARNPLGRHRMNQYWNHTYPPSWITLNPYSGYSDMM